MRGEEEILDEFIKQVTPIIDEELPKAIREGLEDEKKSPEEKD